ncbi:MAG TPA: S41 family peptidase [Fimbriimonadaceae bacterium]|nr:S41 family peptidase [Fimbriimonadaceae bacterium]
MKILGFLFALLFLFCVGFTWRDIQGGRLPKSQAFEKLVGLDTSTKMSPEQEFKQAYNRIATMYYKPVKQLDLKYAGISGMMASLGDPHTMFLIPRVAKQFNQDTKANYVGVGARLSPFTQGGKVIGARAVVVFDDGPGFAAGLKRGDVITRVDGKSVAGLPIEDVVDRIMGEEGTIVRLTVLHEGIGAPTVIPIRRAHVITPTVESQYFPDSKVGYIYIASFSAPTAEQFDKELEKVEQNPMKGLVIDVRGNPGGYLETAVELLSRFTADKVVVSMKMKDGSTNREYTRSGAVHNFGYPVVVLINGDSASAAEIFSGALRDYKMATLVGTHSYGKASVQEVYDFKDGSSGKITIARYFLPSGDNIGRKVDEDGTYVSGGLQPDVEVELADVPPSDLSNANRDSDLPDPKFDSQLRKAIEVVLSKSAR